MKKHITILALILSICLQQAQAQFSLGLNSGIGGLWYKTENTKVKLKPNFGADLGFKHMFRKHWGIVTGIGMAQYSTEAIIASGTNMVANQTDDVGASFEYRIKNQGYKETQQLLSANIPLMMQYRSIKTKNVWYLNFGPKFFIPLDVKVSATAQQLDLSGYYPDVNLEINNLPLHGFGIVNNWGSETKYALKPGVAAAIATGVSFKLPNENRFDVGIYSDYVLTDMRKRKDAPLVTYSAPMNTAATANSVLAIANTNRVRLFSGGIQLKYEFGGKKKTNYSKGSFAAIDALPVKDCDKDSIIDELDACPCQAGPLCTKGCPDSDSDGIADKDDRCPDVKGLPRYLGCPIPDSDSDGINDEDDKCPAVKGLPIYKGCPPPDSDGDGIANEVDKCPDVPGSAKYFGCPAPDTDKDGLNDDGDKCPNTPGPIENQGCPIIKKEVLKKINFVAKNILFKTGTAILTPSSLPGLNVMTDLLRENANANLKIDGHTDNVGADDANLLLSEARAQAVVEYLTSKGISAARLRADGYGKTKPVATNDTPQGKQQNRRVELKLVFD